LKGCAEQVGAKGKLQTTRDY